ncbi:MAG: glycosyltransferase family 2 protein [Alphaproteobacteria bacterium]|nr:glycosyltransferase family 2 protein [Alphaproteobacteria bacterium]
MSATAPPLSAPARPARRAAPNPGAEARDGGALRAPDVSVVVPMFDEAEAAEALVAEIAEAFAGWAFEIIVVDDASGDATAARLAKAALTEPRLRPLRHGANAGQSRAIRTGIRAARAPIIVTLDGDGQNPPADAPALARALMEAPAEVAMVAGERRRRRDPAAKRWASRLANTVRQALLDDGAWDTGCGLKAFRRDAYLALPYFDHMHRYLPALIRREGLGVLYREVGHRPRLSGRSKYTNLGRLGVALFDLAGVVWLRARARSSGAVTALAPDREPE